MGIAKAKSGWIQSVGGRHSLVLQRDRICLGTNTSILERNLDLAEE